MAKSPFPSPATGSSDSRVNILLVDDEPANLLALEAVLEDLQENLVRAQSGEETLRRLREDDFAVILLDVQMPGLDGYATAKRIRAQERSRYTPILFLTASESDRFPIEQAYALGAFDYLVKPLMPEILRAKVAAFAELFRKSEQLQRQTEHLRQSEERFRLLVENVQDYAIFRLDPQGHVLSWNVGAERIKGYRAEEIVGQHIARFYSAEDVLQGKPDRELKAAAAEGRLEDEGWRVRKDGSRFWANVIITAVRDETGTLRGFAKVTRDLTERKRAEDALRRAHDELEQRVRERTAELSEQQEWLRVTLSSIGDAVIATDTEGRVRFMNPKAEEMTGWTQTEVRDTTLEHVFHIVNEETRQDAVNPVKRVLREGIIQGLANHTVLIAKGGTEFPIDDCAAPIRDSDGTMHGAVLVFHDVTDRRELERKLRERAEQLAEADRRKDEFLAMLAHELRGPLAPIRNSLHILRLRVHEEATVEQVRGLMERQVQHLARMLDDLLDMSRITRGKISLNHERLDFARLVRLALEDRRGTVEGVGLSLVLDLPEVPVWVEGDPTRLTQVLDNLLTNAVKFSNRGGRVEARLWVDDPARQAVLAVRDTGIGIEASMLPRLFDIFSQADRSLDRSRGGLGLGLALVKGLVEMHGGTVQAASPGAGRGAEFTIRLPRLEEPAALTEAPDPFPAGSKNLRILVIEDNQDSAESMRLLLTLHGYQVSVANTGPAGVAAAAQGRPEVVLCDIGLPGMDGFAVARALRQNPTTAHVRLIAVTGYGQEQDRQCAREAGFDDHLVKPVDPDQLLGLLDPLAREGKR